MTKLVNRAKMSTATTGTGTITLGTAVAGFQSFAAAGVVDGDVVRYVIEDGTDFEIGTGTFGSAGGTLTRTVSESSNADAALNLTGDAVVFVSATAADFSSAPVSLGVGQTWQNVASNRFVNTTFQNTTGGPIALAIKCSGNSDLLVGSSSTLQNPGDTKDSFAFFAFDTNFNQIDAAYSHGYSAIVPDGDYYRLATNGSVNAWWELR